ncbi:MAG: hypothetical protein Q8873_04470 [Bacillota bacterium]|nr:hypothetical protein [Bacillota bacterium]
MKYLKTILKILLILVAGLLISAIIAVQVTVYIIGGGFEPTTWGIKRDFKNNFEQLSYVGEYLMKSDYSYARTDTISNYEWSYDGKTDLYGNYYDKSGKEKITDKELLDNINKLYKSKFKYIIKEYNYIMFVRWSILDESCGIVYSINGNEPAINVIEGGTVTIKKLSANRWYYYKNIDP